MGCDSFRHAVTENLGTDFKILLWIPFLLNSISVFWFLPREGYSVSKGQKFTLNAHLRPFLDFKTEIIYIFGENVTPAEKTVFPWKTGLKKHFKEEFFGQYVSSSTPCDANYTSGTKTISLYTL